MDAINTLRALLVAGAVLAAVVATVAGRWSTVGILAVALVAHGLMWRHQYRVRQRSDERLA